MASPYHSKSTGNDAVHPATYVGSSDPASPDTSVTADDKLWIDTTTGTTFATGWLLKIRATGNTVWTTILDLATTLALKANLASPTFTGVPAAPTAAPGTNTTQLATTAFVAAAGAGVSSVFGRSGAVTAQSGDYTVAQVTNAAATTGNLSQFASTTSAQLATLISDETGSGGAVVFATGPTLSNPVVGTQSAGDNSTKAASTAYADNAVAKGPEDFQAALSDETTAITTGTKLTFRVAGAKSMTALPRFNLNTVSSSGTPTFDIKKNGSTIFTTKVTIDVSELTSVTATTGAALISSPTTFADDDEVTVSIDDAGTGAVGAKMTLMWNRA